MGRFKMKIMIASDIHGSAKYCRELIAAYEREGAQKLLLLGDILYHGPRNGLCDGYDPVAVAEILNGMKSEILCVQGNCDSEVDQMVLEFPIMSQTCLLNIDGITALAIHGHKDMDSLPLGGIDIVFSGHTHVPKCEEKSVVLFCNPGSVSIPKEGSEKGYMTLTDRLLEWKTLAGDVYMSREV